MPTVFDPQDRAALLKRVASLTPRPHGVRAMPEYPARAPGESFAAAAPDPEHS